MTVARLDKTRPKRNVATTFTTTLRQLPLEEIRKQGSCSARLSLILNQRLTGAGIDDLAEVDAGQEVAHGVESRRRRYCEDQSLYGLCGCTPATAADRLAVGKQAFPANFGRANGSSSLYGKNDSCHHSGSDLQDVVASYNLYCGGRANWGFSAGLMHCHRCRGIPRMFLTGNLAFLLGN